MISIARFGLILAVLLPVMLWSGCGGGGTGGQTTPPPPSCASFFPVDVFVSMNGQSAGTAVTTTNLAPATEGTYSGWGAASSAATFGASQATLPANVIIRGTATHACGYATQSLAQNGDVQVTTSQMNFGSQCSGSSCTQATVSGLIANLPIDHPTSGTFYDMVLLFGGSHSYTATLQLNNGTAGPCSNYGFEIESSSPGGQTVHSNCVTGVAATQTVYYSFHSNWTSSGTCGTVSHTDTSGDLVTGPAPAPCAEGNIYSVSGSDIGAQIGDTMAVQLAGNDVLGGVWLGNNETAHDVGTYYFQWTMVDYTAHVFPNVPPS